jgi:ABC-type dipeptide/oligopeptide/nickel transport system permease component
VNQYILRRIIISIPLILTIVAIVFIMLRVAIPGDTALALAGENPPQELVEQIRKNLGLDRPVLEQFLIYLGNIARGDLGRSSKFGENVLDLISKAFPYTVLLTFQSVGVGTVIGLIFGVITAVKRGSWMDHLGMVIVVFFNAIPTFWLGLILILVFAVGLRWLPVQGAGTWKHFVLPVTTLSVGEAALIARLTRSSLIETLNTDYVRTARAKGLSEATVVLIHAFKNTLIPIITVVGLSVGGLLGGAVITESIFGLPGVGRLTIEAIYDRDYPLIQGTVMLVAITFVFVNLVVDIIYAVVDPRIRYD